MDNASVTALIDLASKGGIVVILLVILWRFDQKYDRLLAVIIENQRQIAQAVAMGAALMAEKAKRDGGGGSGGDMFPDGELPTIGIDELR